MRVIDILGEPYPRIIRNYSGSNNNILKNCEILHVDEMSNTNNNLIDSEIIPFLNFKKTNIKKIVRSDINNILPIIYSSKIVSLTNVDTGDYVNIKKIKSLKKISGYNVSPYLESKWLNCLKSIGEKLTHLDVTDDLPKKTYKYLPNLTHLSVDAPGSSRIKFPKTLIYLRLYGKLKYSLEKLKLHEGLLHFRLSEYTGNIIDRSLPASLEELEVEHGLVSDIDEHALKNVKMLKLDVWYNYSVEVLPETLETLILGETNEEISVSFPPNIKYIHLFDRDYNWTIDSLPDNLKEYKCTGVTTLECELPNSLEKLWLVCDKLDRIINIPNKVTELAISENCIEYIKVNHTLKKLKLL